MFVATVIDNGGLSACIVAGIFYALSLHIRGFDTPVWSVNAPTAVVKVTVSGKGRNRFLFPADKHFTGMTAFDKKCLNGKGISLSDDLKVWRKALALLPQTKPTQFPSATLRRIDRIFDRGMRMLQAAIDKAMEKVESSDENNPKP